MRRADLTPYLENFEALPFVRHARIARGTGGELLRLETPTKTFELPVQLERSTVTHELAQRRMHLRAKLPELVLLAPSIGAELGATLVDGHVFFMDLAGNCYLDLEHRYVAHKQGFRSASRPIESRGLRAPAMRVLFTLLATPGLSTATTRALASAAGGVSPQTAADTRARLEADEVLVRTRDGFHFRTEAWRRGLDLYLRGFRETLPALTVGPYRSRARSPEATRRELEAALTTVPGWRWGGAAAAALLEGHYKGERTILYAPAWGDEVRSLPLVTDPSGPIELRRAPCPAALAGPRVDCVHPLLVYADLLSPKRTIGPARVPKAIYERYLAPIAEAAA
ncbi:MAG: hypothetical protein IPJ34_31200 [Myxococcales bacterium]|nr:hypothetical protein [Myxococcales bacterium]